MSTKRDTFKVEDSRDDLPFQIHWELDDAPLSVWAFRVYAHLVRRAGKNGEIFPSYQSIGEACFRATNGPEASPLTLRNKAMLAMKELVTAGLVIKQNRSKKGMKEHDTNVYTLTPRRQWLDELKARRASLEEATEAAQVQRQADAKAAKGGTPTVLPSTPTVLPSTPTVLPPSTPSVPPSTPSVPKVTSTEVLQSFEVNSIEAPSQEPESPLISSPISDAAAAFSPNGSNTTPAEHSNPEGGDDLPEFFTGSSQEQGKPENGTTSSETVPAGGPAPKYAILGLAAIPRTVLNARPARDPERMPQLRALLSASHKSRLPHLMAQLATATQTGGLPRDLLTRLTDEELTLASAAAKLDAGNPGGFAKFSTLALDRLIGAPITQAIIEGAAFSVPAPQGRAYDVKNEPARASVEQPAEPVEAAPRVDFSKYLGLWELRANPNQVVDVVEVQERPGSTPLLHLKTEDTLSVTDITLKYRRPAYAAD
ncbi:helix-turn-helix domain-containing protein [Deinococcus sp. QL22]|uniref:helix-turn-helix domain-containing protein n=1 Tax=Deinococcus sp. QL22 TaxID=2939437 RepID=UPI002017B563|nr:helix-turn-helix domain-containing protein [Deinococcus sp. QL22]UQN10405.1 helix-turn-helix domain-containing protein [Deinococcus sp. QL22]UQN10539.1 helix-turn-helix domain-containing protein [Deinococcus sp. QL22]